MPWAHLAMCVCEQPEQIFLGAAIEKHNEIMGTFELFHPIARCPEHCVRWRC